MDNWLAPLRLCPSVRLPVRSSVRPSVCLSGCPSVCLFISLSIRPSVLSQLSLRRRRLNVWVVALLLERRSFHKIVCSLHYALLQRPRSMFALHRNCCTSVRACWGCLSLTSRSRFPTNFPRLQFQRLFLFSKEHGLWPIHPSSLSRYPPLPGQPPIIQ